MSELDANLTQLRTSFDEIEKRIKAIERQVTASTQLTATKACLEEIKILLEDYQNAYNNHLENYNNHSAECDAHIQESTQNISNLQSASSIYGASINTLTTTANTIQSNLERLSARVLALEQSSDNSSGETTVVEGSGATNWEDIVYFYYGQEMNTTSAQSNFYVLQTLFDCEPGFVDIEYTFEIYATSANNVQLYAIWDFNKKIYPDIKLDAFTGKYTIVLKKQFLTSKRLNYVKMYFKVPPTKIFMNTYSVKIHAKNVKIFQRFQPIEIYCFNNNYYITDMTDPNKFYYGIVSKENFSYNKANLTAINYSDIGYKHLATKLMPAIANSDTIQLRTDNDGSYLVTHTMGSSLTYLTAYHKLTGATSYTKYCSSSSITFSDDFNPFTYNSSGVGIHNFIVISDCVRIINANGNYINICLNNVMLTYYSYISLVKDINLKIGDPMPPYRGAIICRASDNMFVFFPEINSTYCVEIDKGKNATAYYQPDGSIFVYINRGHQVFKYKLQKNEQDKYENIGAIDIFDNIIKYEELYDGYALVSTIDSCEIISP